MEISGQTGGRETVLRRLGTPAAGNRACGQRRQWGRGGMDDIVPVTEGGAPVAVGQEADAAHGYAAASRAASTRLIYDADWRRFQTCCAARGVPPLPANSVTVARYCANEAEAGCAPSTITRRLAAIGWVRTSSPGTSRRSTPTVAGRSPRSWPASGGRVPRRRRKKASGRRRRCATCWAPAPVRSCAPCGRARCLPSGLPARSGGRNWSPFVSRTSGGMPKASGW